MKKHQWLVFRFTLLTVGIVLASHMSALLPVYTFANVRTKILTLVTATAQREGWLLSGLQIQDITGGTKIFYRSYLRGDDPLECHTIDYATGQLGPCNLRQAQVDIKRL